MSFWSYSYRIWRYLVCRTFLWARIRPKKLIRALGQKCIQILWDHQKKIPFVENCKECTIGAILRENAPFCLAATEAKTCLAMLSRGPKIMHIPRGYRKKCLLRRKSALLSVRWKFHCVAKIILGLFL